MSHRRKPKKIRADRPVAFAPVASRFATYNGDATHMAEKGEVVGPNLLGERLTAVSAHYEAEAGKTRVGFAYGKMMAY